MTRTWITSTIVVLAITSVAACGDGNDSADPPASTGGQATGDLDAFCAAAGTIAGDEGFPSATRAATYASLAPPEVRDAVETVAKPYVAHEGDDVALFAAIADDDVEDAFRVVNAFESQHCGIDNRDVNREDIAIDDDANRVDVRAVDYAFEMPETLPAGPTSLVLTNDGQEAHFMLIFRIEPGHTLHEVLAFEGDPQEAGLVTDLGLESGFAAPGGDDIEVINADLEAGDYALVCFLPGPDGTPHALMGMATPFTVT